MDSRQRIFSAAVSQLEERNRRMPEAPGAYPSGLDPRFADQKEKGILVESEDGYKVSASRFALRKAQPTAACVSIEPSTSLLLENGRPNVSGSLTNPSNARS